MATNTITYRGKTHTRKGKVMPFVTIALSGDDTLVEWASTLENARKVASAHTARASKVRAGQKLGGVFSTSWYANFGGVEIFPTTQS